MEPTFPASVVISIGALVLSGLLGLVIMLIRSAWEQRGKEFDRRLDEETKRREKTESASELAAAEVRKLAERVHQDELATARLQGDVNLVKQNHEGLEADLAEIKKQMITKVEFEAKMANQDRMLNLILSRVDGTRYTPHAGMPRVKDPRREGGG